MAAAGSGDDAIVTTTAELIAAGAQVVVVGRNPDGVAGAEVVLGGKALAFAGDATHAETAERAIGVIYRPETELASHYFQASLPEQFDEYVWFDETRAVTALGAAAAHGMPETYPFGV